MRAPLFAILIALVALDCSSVGSSAHAPDASASDTDSDTDVDTDVDGDTDTDADTGTGECTGVCTWVDESTGLVWQNPPLDNRVYYENATAYCDGLELEGHDEWRLPTLSELRSLIRGCPLTVTGGDCQLADDCLTVECYEGEACNGCASGEGPGLDGCYWDETLVGECGYYWSSTHSLPEAWQVYFHRGSFFDATTYENKGVVRCVLDGV